MATKGSEVTIDDHRAKKTALTRKSMFIKLTHQHFDVEWGKQKLTKRSHERFQNHKVWRKCSKSGQKV